MNRVRAKLHNCKGETLVEVLASILIASLSVALLLGAVAASANINRQAEASDERFYEALTTAESRSSTPINGQVGITVSGKGITMELEIQAYGSGDLWSYALTPTGGGGS